MGLGCTAHVRMEAHKRFQLFGHCPPLPNSLREQKQHMQESSYQQWEGLLAQIIVKLPTQLIGRQNQEVRLQQQFAQHIHKEKTEWLVSFSTISTRCDILKQGVRKPKGMLTWLVG